MTRQGPADDPAGALLDAVIDRIIPADHDPGALALGTPVYVRARLTADPRLAAEVAGGLSRLSGLAAPADLASLPEDHRDRLLTQVEAEAWFVALAELTAEGFYANPANGGNSGAGSWAMIGYRHGLPEGPDGPPANGSGR